MKTTDHEQLAISNLRIAATASAEEQRHHAPPQRRKLTAFAWSFAAAALAICIYIPRMPHHPQPLPPQPQIVAQEQAPTISDDVLLADIQDDLSASLPTPMLPLTTTTTKSTTQRK